MGETQFTRSGDEFRVVIGAQLTAANASDLQESLKKEISKDARKVVLDMTHTTTLDSTGIGLLIATSNSLKAVQGEIRLIHVPADIMKLLKSMRLVDRLHASAGEGGNSSG